MKQVNRLAKVANSTDDANMARMFKVLVKLGRVVTSIYESEKMQQNCTASVTNKLDELKIRYRVEQGSAADVKYATVHLEGNTLLDDIVNYNTLFRTGDIDLMPADIKKIYSYG